MKKLILVLTLSVVGFCLFNVGNVLVDASEKDQVRSTGSIRFTDSSLGSENIVTTTPDGTKENNGSLVRNLPKTGEKQNIVSYLLGYLILGISLIYLCKSKLKIKKR